MNQHLIETESTNAWLMNLARERRGAGTALPDLYAVFTDFQTAGRGAGTNKWHSSRGLNILTSIYFETKLAAVDQFLFNLWFSTATRQFLAKHVPEVLIKWPNDMYVRDHKLAGDLTEHSVSGGLLDFTVAGIGINVNEEHFPENIPHPTSLFLETGQHLEVKPLLDEYMETLRQRRPLLNLDYANELREEYMSHLYHFNEAHPYITHGQQITGIIRDIDQFGRLLMEHEDGTIHAYEYKQIAYVFDM